MVLQQLCGWTENKNGRVICATVATIGGLHLFLTPPQDVLGFLPKFSFLSSWVVRWAHNNLLAVF